MNESPVSILCVDDEPNVLEGLTRQLRRHYAVTTAAGGEDGLQALEKSGPFAVVISDMRMPGMDGAAFLAQVRERAPESTRMLLTGHADMQSAIAAVNEGQIFRFLTKPCAPDVLLKSLNAATEQHRLVTSERVLLEQTLHGCIKALTDILALANPAAFGRASRAKAAASTLAAKLNVETRWPIEVAAMLAPIGCIALPPRTAEKLYRGQDLGKAEMDMVAKLPVIAEQLLAPIPRLEPVREILANLSKRFEVVGSEPPPLSARILKAVLDMDELESQGFPFDRAISELHGRVGCYDPAVLEALASSRALSLAATTRQVALSELREGMVFTEDVLANNDMLLVARGQEVGASLLARLKNFADAVGVREPLCVTIKPFAVWDFPRPTDKEQT